ncbi:amidohydrolase [Phlegmacium glaucopus]|nr:amidohydrolase [Phlegmacium glaucopus]
MAKAVAVPDVMPATRPKPRRLLRFQRLLGFFLCCIVVAQSFGLLTFHTFLQGKNTAPVTISAHHRSELQAICTNIRTPAGPPQSFNTAARTENDRFVPGTPPVLLRNATIWTGARNGTEIVYGDVLLDRGLVVAVGYIPPSLLDGVRQSSTSEVRVEDVGGAWITPGLVDLHSHLGVMSAPALSGAADTNSHKAPILPWLRSIDGLNTHDAAYELAIAGGVTTVQILPGSANNIGGQSFVIKLRPTAERSSTSKVVEPPQTLINSPNGTSYIRWRHMKHACGENPDRRYSQTRMDGQWNFRNAYNEAKKVKDAQDAFCQKVEAEEWNSLVGDKGKFPESLQWEALVDVLRGRVKLSVHCYEAVDLDGIVRLSNEFQFPVASFHHAGETYLVPDLLKKAWGGAPSIALFASNFKKKREAYRGSEFAPRILADHGIPVVMKSDHPVMNSRYLMFEAQQAHYYGLNPALALASVTSTPARAAGMDHRVGTIAEGYDADIVIWDSHPLALGATPRQVYIDGIVQLNKPQALIKPSKFQVLPKTPNWDREAEESVRWDGVPPLTGNPEVTGGKTIKIIGVKSVWHYGAEGRVETLFDDKEGEGRSVVVQDGRIVCAGDGTSGSFCGSIDEAEVDEVVNLRGGSLAPGLTSYGSPLGLVEISLEPSTNDGVVLDPLVNGNLPSILGKDTAIIRAVDGLQFQGRNTLLAYRNGVTTAITAPSGRGFLQGLSTAFSAGSPHALARGAIVQEETALHVTISFSLDSSVSTQIAALRSQLFESSLRPWFRVREGEIPLVVDVSSADIMATLVALKQEYEDITGNDLRLTFSGAAEAHLLAKEIARAGISVILTSPRAYPTVWEQRRILPGPPLSKLSSLGALLAEGVNVAIGVIDESAARNTRFEIAWAALESNGTIDKFEAFALASYNLEQALGLTRDIFEIPDLVMYQGGGVFDFESKVIGVISVERRVVDLF